MDEFMTGGAPIGTSSVRLVDLKLETEDHYTEARFIVRRYKPNVRPVYERVDVNDIPADIRKGILSMLGSDKMVQDAYERGWSDACTDFLQQQHDPSWSIGRSKQQPYDPEFRH